ncbi:hypothetical protein [Streptomyces sp. NPDC058653]|uniref:hypothetical protein n=1 Tax=Streptomyces sp. NPDC058653 TaxID=3346576 RepID=UPI00365A8DF9
MSAGPGPPSDDEVARHRAEADATDAEAATTIDGLGVSPTRRPARERRASPKRTTTDE